MHIEPHILASCGSFSVAVIALLFALLQAWLYAVRREHVWHFWGMLLSLSTMIFAFGVFLQFYGQPDEMNRVADKLQITGIILLAYFALWFTYSFLGLSTRTIYQWLGAVFHILLIVLVWKTRLIISDQFVYRDFLFLSKPYIEPRLGWLGILVFTYVGIAVSAVMVILLQNLNTHQGESKNLSLYFAGFIFWLSLGVHDILVTLFNLKSILFLMEYGFLAFSIAVVVVVLKTNIDLSALAEQRAQNLVREKERYEALSEVIFDYAFAFRVEPDGRFIPDWTVGPIERMTGFTARELSDFKTLRTFIHAEDRPVVKQHMLRLLEGNSETVEFRIRTKRGQTRWMRNHGRSIYDHQQQRTTYIYGAMQDITEKKEAEKALRENERKYRLLVENANDAIIILQNGRVLFPNPRALAITGYSLEELTKIDIEDLLHPEDKEMVIEKYEESLSGQEIERPYTFRLVTRQRQIRIVQINTVHISWENQPATLNFVRDVTVEKKLEEQLQQRKKFEAIGILAGGLSHDINNAMTGILGNLELLKYKFDRDQLDEVNMDRYLSQIMTSAHRVTDKCQKLLAYSRKGSCIPQPVDINDIIVQTVEAIPETDRSRIRFHTELADALFVVCADADQMKLVISAIVQNAMESIRDTGEIKISTDFTAVNADSNKALRPGVYAVISVVDSGAGMDEEIKSRVFDPFFTTKFHGRGMSLAAVYGILKSHRGIIQIDSKPQKGTAVRIYIPAEPSSAGNNIDLKTESLLAAGGRAEL